MNKYALLAAAAAIAATAPPALAQSTTGQSQADRIGSIFGALFGDRLGTTTSLEAQWAAGRTPLAAQRNQFDTRVDAEIRAGNLTQAVGARSIGRPRAPHPVDTRRYTRHPPDGRAAGSDRWSS